MKFSRKSTKLFSLTVFLTIVLVATVPILTSQQPATKPRVSHRPSVPGVHGLVTSGHPLASMAGMQMLLKGGNAMDASVAVLAALNVVRYQMSGGGGNGFMTIYEKSSGKVYSLGATGAAPKNLKADELSAEELHRGLQVKLDGFHYAMLADKLQ